MAHVRQQIRKLVVTTLTGLPTSGANVFESMTRAINERDLPGLWVYTTPDVLGQPKGTGDDRTKEHRMLRVAVEARAVDSNNVQDVIDQMCEEAQGALYADVTLGGAVRDLKLESFELALVDEVQKPYAIGRMSFELEYRIDGKDPGTIIA